MKFRARTNRTVLSAALCSGILSVLSGEARASDSYTLFESGQVRPLALLAERQAAVRRQHARQPAGGLQCRITRSSSTPPPSRWASSRSRSRRGRPRGLGGQPPLGQREHRRARRRRRRRGQVVRTLLVGDEPRDIVFAGRGSSARSSPRRIAARTSPSIPSSRRRAWAARTCGCSTRTSSAPTQAARSPSSPSSPTRRARSR